MDRPKSPSLAVYPLSSRTLLGRLSDSFSIVSIGLASSFEVDMRPENAPWLGLISMGAVDDTLLAIWKRVERGLGIGSGGLVLNIKSSEKDLLNNC